jgi:hypothetical protein
MYPPAFHKRTPKTAKPTLFAIEEFDDSCPRYEEPVIILHLISPLEKDLASHHGATP